MPDDTQTEFCWLVEEFAPNGNSTGRYMLDMGSLAITHDVYAARRLRREQSAGFRALDMKERHGGDWRPVEHGFEPAPAAQPAMPEPVALPEEMTAEEIAEYEAEELVVINLAKAIMRAEGDYGDPHRMIYSGGPIPEPWGEAWQRHEDQARKIVELLTPATAAALAAQQCAQMVEALEKANQFITNGIALGFIRMPDADCPDPAHATPGIVRAALAAARKGQSHG